METGFSWEPGSHALPFRDPPHCDKEGGHQQSSEQQIGTSPAEACPGIIRKVTDNGIRQGIPQTRNDQDYAQPESAESEADVPHQADENAGDIEESDGND